MSLSRRGLWHTVNCEPLTDKGTQCTVAATWRQTETWLTEIMCHLLSPYLEVRSSQTIQQSKRETVYGFACRFNITVSSLSRWNDWLWREWWTTRFQSGTCSFFSQASQLRALWRPPSPLSHTSRILSSLFATGYWVKLLGCEVDNLHETFPRSRLLTFVMYFIILLFVRVYTLSAQNALNRSIMGRSCLSMSLSLTSWLHGIEPTESLRSW
jgi:hypothetical protein